MRRFASLLLVALLIPPLLAPQHWIFDDSYFYLVIARNIIQGFGSTFNRLMPTNGYHPLWMLFCLPSGWVSGEHPFLALRGIVMLQEGMFLLSAWLFVRLCRSLGLTQWPYGLMVIGVFFLGLRVFASEAHLNGLMTLTALRHIHQTRLTRSAWNAWVAGLLLGLLFLARLDTLFLCALLALYALMPFRGRKGLVVQGVSLGFGFCILALPYLIHNRVVYGHWVPISGFIKSTFPSLAMNPDSLGATGMVLTAILGGILVVFAVSREKTRLMPLAILSAGALLQNGYVFLFTNHHTVWPWYQVTAFIALALAVVHVVGWGFGKYPRIAGIDSRSVVALSALVLFLAGGVGRSWIRVQYGSTFTSVSRLRFLKESPRWQIATGLWLKQRLPAGAGVLMCDWPGTIAYFSGLKILATDGLTTNFDYCGRLSEKGLKEMIKEYDIRYWVGPLDDWSRRFTGFESRVIPGNHAVGIYVPGSQQYAGSLMLPDSDMVVKFTDLSGSEEAARYNLALWKLAE